MSSQFAVDYLVLEAVSSHQKLFRESGDPSTRSQEDLDALSELGLSGPGSERSFVISRRPWRLQDLAHKPGRAVSDRPELTSALG